MTMNLLSRARYLLLPGVMALAGCGAEDVSLSPVASAQEPGPTIQRFQEGTNFNNVIAIPPGAETLYLSGAGAVPKEDGTWGNMEEQAIQIFETYKTTLEEMGWSLEDIVQVRVFVPCLVTACEDTGRGCAAWCCLHHVGSGHEPLCQDVGKLQV